MYSGWQRRLRVPVRAYRETGGAGHAGALTLQDTRAQQTAPRHPTRSACSASRQAWHDLWSECVPVHLFLCRKVCLYHAAKPKQTAAHDPPGQNRARTPAFLVPPQPSRYVSAHPLPREKLPLAALQPGPVSRKTASECPASRASIPQAQDTTKKPTPEKDVGKRTACSPFPA